MPPHPPFLGSHGPPSPACGAIVYPPPLHLYPNCEAFGMGTEEERALSALGWGGLEGLQALPHPGLWGVPGLEGLGNAAPKLVAKSCSLILGGPLQSPCPTSLAGVGAGSPPWPWGSFQGDFVAFAGTSVPHSSVPPAPVPTQFTSSPFSVVCQMFHLKKWSFLVFFWFFFHCFLSGF